MLHGVHGTLRVGAAFFSGGVPSTQGLLFLVGWSVTDWELADGRVSDPNSTWKVVAGETSKETSMQVTRWFPGRPPEVLRVLPQLQRISRPGLRTCRTTAASKPFNLQLLLGVCCCFLS